MQWPRISSSACSSASCDGYAESGGGRNAKLAVMSLLAETVRATRTAAAAAAAAAVKIAMLMTQATPVVMARVLAPWGVFSALLEMHVNVWLDFAAASSWKPG